MKIAKRIPDATILIIAMPLKNCRVVYADQAPEEGAYLFLSREFGQSRIAVSHNVSSGYSRTYYGVEEYGIKFWVEEGETCEDD